MKDVIYTLICILVSACSISPKIFIVGNNETKYVGEPKYKENERFYDNLSEKKMPIIFSDYYHLLKKSDFKTIKIVIDTVKDDFYYQTNIYTFSKKANSGYLLINKYINDSLLAFNGYILNSDTVNNDFLIKKLISLNKKEIYDYELENSYIKITSIQFHNRTK
ncbi:hypothetical protein FACS1894178_6180 [Bacteroidia bacterium]|nr:hypothetical protein FACS1894178_6180 [Bacteroidia bacterium]